MILLKLSPLLNDMVEVRPSSFDPAVRDQFRTVPGATWDPDRRAYIVPLEALDSVLTTLERARVARVDRSALATGANVDTTGDATRGRLLSATSLSGRKLLPHQLEGIEFLRAKLRQFSAGILADEMGLMKTAQAIFTCTPGKLTIVVCPAVVGGHWVDEIRDWTNEPTLLWTGKKKPKHFDIPEMMKLAVADGRLPLRDGSTVRWLVLSYDMFRRLESQLPPCDQLILDELHYVGHSKSLRSKAVRGYLARCAQRPKIIGLTGTPITAWLQNLHNPLDLLLPGRFGTWFQFTSRYCGGRFEDIVAKNGSPVLDGEGLPRRAWKADGVSNLDELRSRLSHFMLRRTKQDSGLELPPRIRTTIPVELPATARRELRTMLTDVRSPDALRRALVGVEAYKLDAAVELATELRNAGSRVLLFTCRRSHAAALGARLRAPVVDGAVDPSERKARLLGAPVGTPRAGGHPETDKGGTDVAVATMFSVTTGIDLTHFDSAIFVGLDWVPSNLLQAEARLHRPGQKKTVNVYFLIGRPSIDEHIRKVVVDRLETFSQVLGADATTNERELASDLEDRSDLIAQIVKLVEESTP